MFRKKIKLFHKKKPYIEPIVLSISTIALGFFLSIYATFLHDHPSLPFWNNKYLWISLVFLSFIIIYYIFFSTYSYTVKEANNKEKMKLLKAYVEITETCIKDGNDNLSYKVNNIFSSAIDNLDKLN